MINVQALESTVVKLVKGYITLKKALNSLNGALLDATHEWLCAYDDECAFCEVSCPGAWNFHYFHS